MSLRGVCISSALKCPDLSERGACAEVAPANEHMAIVVLIQPNGCPPIDEALCTCSTFSFLTSRHFCIFAARVTRLPGAGSHAGGQRLPCGEGMELSNTGVVFGTHTKGDVFFASPLFGSFSFLL